MLFKDVSEPIEEFLPLLAIVGLVDWQLLQPPALADAIKPVPTPDAIIKKSM